MMFVQIDNKYFAVHNITYISRFDEEITYIHFAGKSYTRVNKPIKEVMSIIAREATVIREPDNAG